MTENMRSDIWGAVDKAIFETENALLLDAQETHSRYGYASLDNEINDDENVLAYDIIFNENINGENQPVETISVTRKTEVDWTFNAKSDTTLKFSETEGQLSSRIEEAGLNLFEQIFDPRGGADGANVQGSYRSTLLDLDGEIIRIYNGVCSGMVRGEQAHNEIRCSTDVTDADGTTLFRMNELQTFLGAGKHRTYSSQLFRPDGAPIGKIHAESHASENSARRGHFFELKAERSKLADL